MWLLWILKSQDNKLDVAILYEMLFSNKSESILVNPDLVDSNIGQVRVNSFKLSSQCPVSQDSL